MKTRALLVGLAPKSLRFLVKDLIERLKYFFPKAMTGRPHLKLDATQIYPEGNNFFASIEQLAKENLKLVNFNKTTPIASIGSCFAEEFAGYCIRSNFNYMRKEPNPFNASAEWGRVYTTASFKEIVDYSLKDSPPIVIQHSNGRWYDPLRENSVADSISKEEMTRAILKHREISKEVFQSAKILTVTIGQNETWLHKSTRKHHSRLPLSNQEILNSEYELKRLSVEENVDNLKAAFDDLFKSNPELTVILTVSPVPSSATFFDTHVIPQSFTNKCILRLAAEKILELFPNRILYFPSFEIVLAHNPSSYRADNRHVTYHRVGKIFKILDRALNN